MSTKSIGREGEDIAASYLKKNKVKILERNYHSRFGEIDIIVGGAVLAYGIERIVKHCKN